MASREDVHRLVDLVPEARLPVLERLLRTGLTEGVAPIAPREFSCAGTLSDDHDLAERSEEVLREDPEESDQSPTQ